MFIDVTFDDLRNLSGYVFSEFEAPCVFIDVDLDQKEINASLDYYKNLNLVNINFYPNMEIQSVKEINGTSTLFIVYPKDLATFRYLLLMAECGSIFLVTSSIGEIVNSLLNTLHPKISGTGQYSGYYIGESIFKKITSMCHKLIITHEKEGCLIFLSEDSLVRMVEILNGIGGEDYINIQQENNAYSYF